MSPSKAEALLSTESPASSRTEAAGGPAAHAAAPLRKALGTSGKPSAASAPGVAEPGAGASRFLPGQSLPGLGLGLGLASTLLLLRLLQEASCSTN